MGNTNIS